MNRYIWAGLALVVIAAIMWKPVAELIDVLTMINWREDDEDAD